MEKNKYCPQGHLWIKVNNTLIFSDYCYCKECDEIYVLNPMILKKETVNQHFNSDRYEEMKRLANIKDAKEKVNVADLEKLGYLTKH